MIYGIGTDIVEIARIQRVLEKYGSRFIDKVLNESEKKAMQVTNKPEAFLAKRFAAKEATAKAFGTGFINGLSMQQIIVANDDYGRPTLRLEETAAKMADELKIGAKFLSLSDERSYAVAYVVLEKII